MALTRCHNQGRIVGDNEDEQARSPSKHESKLQTAHASKPQTAHARAPSKHDSKLQTAHAAIQQTAHTLKPRGGVINDFQ